MLPRVAGTEDLRLVSIFKRPNFLIMVEAGFDVEQFKCFFSNRALFVQAIQEQIVETIFVEQFVSGPFSSCWWPPRIHANFRMPRCCGCLHAFLLIALNALHVGRVTMAPWVLAWLTHWIICWDTILSRAHFFREHTWSVNSWSPFGTVGWGLK